MTAVDVRTAPEEPPTRPRPWWRSPVLRATVGVTVVAVAVVTLHDHLPDVSDVAAALSGAEENWLIVAGVAMALSIAMFARQQRRLLTGMGIVLPRHQALALAASRSALSISLPAGAAVSAAYAYRQYRVSGADRRSATTVMVLSGVLSMTGLALLYSTGALAAALFGVTAAWQAQPALLIGAVALLVTTVVGLVRYASRTIAPRHWLLAQTASVANWAADLLCLVATVYAFDLPLGLMEIGALYLTVQLVRQIPLTPGGIGVVEASLLAGMIGLGSPQAAATAAVLTYRLFSCWLIIPSGVIGWFVLRRRRPLHNGSPDAPAPLVAP